MGLETIAIIGAAGALTQGLAGFQQARFQQAVAKRNEAAARDQAAAEEERFRRDRQRRIGATRAAFAASGTRVEGSPLEVLADQAMIAEEDALLIRHGGEIRAGEQALRAKVAGQQAAGSLLSGFVGAGASIGGGYLAAQSRGEPFFGFGGPSTTPRGFGKSAGIIPGLNGNPR